MTTEQRLNKEIADLREMQATLAILDLSMNQIMRERDLYRDENQRLQIEVARLRLANREANAELMESVG